ncbi:hypothetical protein ACRALDRAFT_1062422 [Sodiomyces alcalophilus JCM 7366]|uniref:uncharacterized protein n=1 Tax=Sodiomyces alcalophilus JCM 7366 TaxID=591952 RepID=UPI0039B547AF
MPKAPRVERQTKKIKTRLKPPKGFQDPVPSPCHELMDHHDHLDIMMKSPAST